MKAATIRLLIPMMALLVGGCASVNSVSLTPIPAERNSPVRVERSKVIVLGLSFDNDFINEMVDDLKRQCPGGRVTGILTKDEDINYFLYLVYSKRVTAQGFCVGRTASNSQFKKSRKTSSEDSADVHPESHSESEPQEL